MDQIALGKRLRYKRDNILKKSLSQLGDMIGLNKGHLSQIERGKIDVPNVDTLRKIARAYEVNFKELANVFFKTEEKAEEMIKMDIVMKQVASDEKYKFRELIEDAMEENMGEKTKLLIIRMYEKMYNGKKLI